MNKAGSPIKFFDYADERQRDMAAMVQAVMKGAGRHTNMQRHYARLRQRELQMERMKLEKSEIDERIVTALKTIMDYDGAKSMALAHLLIEVEDDIKSIKKSIEAEIEHGYTYPEPLDGKVAG